MPRKASACARAAAVRSGVPGLPIAPERYESFVAAVAGLDKASAIDELVRLTLPD